jgi:hypothetical protein
MSKCAFTLSDEYKSLLPRDMLDGYCLVTNKAVFEREWYKREVELWPEDIFHLIDCKHSSALIVDILRLYPFLKKSVMCLEGKNVYFGVAGMLIDDQEATSDLIIGLLPYAMRSLKNSVLVAELESISVPYIEY